MRPEQLLVEVRNEAPREIHCKLVHEKGLRLYNSVLSVHLLLSSLGAVVDVDGVVCMYVSLSLSLST